MLKIGDIVRFLNDVGGGRVVGFKGKNTVLVEDEDGFEIPVLIAECVCVGNAQEDSKKSFENPIQTKNGELINLSLAYCLNKGVGENSDFQVYAVNSCNYYLFLNYLCKDEYGKYYTQYSGIVQPYSKERLFFFGNKFLNDFNRKFILRAIPYKLGKKYDLKPIYEVELNLDPTFLLKSSSFKSNDKVDEPAYILDVISENEIKYFSLEDKINTLEDRDFKIISKLKEKDKFDAKIKSSNTVNINEIDEVDLHASEVLETTAGMGPFDILSYQVNIFKQTMDKYYGKHSGKKIVFIHGKGEGVLRQAILKELKKAYPKSKYQDASFREYGFGATLVFV